MEQCESLNEKLFPPSAEGPTNCPFPKKSEEPKKRPFIAVDGACETCDNESNRPLGLSGAAMRGNSAWPRNSKPTRLMQAAGRTEEDSQWSFILQTRSVRHDPPFRIF